MRRVGFLMLWLAAPALAQTAQTAPAATAQGDIRVTVYNDDLALVQDTRQLTLPAGRSRQEFADVSAQIRPETVSFDAADASIVEQNFDYDLLSPSKLMEKAVGKTITLIRTNPATGVEAREVATVLAVNGGAVLRIGNRIEVLRDDGLPVRVVFDGIPENLRARPTLSVTVESQRGGVRPATLSYLTPGMGWKADYVASFDETAGRIDVQGWVTLTNGTGTSFANAATTLVAGSMAPEQEQGRYIRRRRPDRNSLREAGTETANRERLGDFYLYPLAARTTIANAQTKQVSFLDVAGAAGRRAYEYRNSWLGTTPTPTSADSVVKFSTSGTDGPGGKGLGDALPAGIVRVYMKDARGNAQFVGENAIGHTPMGSELGLKTGDAFDVKVRATVVKREQTFGKRTNAATGKPVEERIYRTTMSYTLTNARPNAVTVDLLQSGVDTSNREDRIVSESLASTRPSTSEVLWRVPVPAAGSTEVTATFETRN